jgi:hypothetical protein
MSLNLAVPSPEQSTLAPVETRPKQVAEWLERLPMANLLDASRAVRDALSALNRHKVDEDTRLKLLELYRATASELVHGMEAQFAGAALPLPEKQRQIAILTRELLVELAYGYKIIVLEDASKRISFGANKQLPLILQRALSGLSWILVICYQTYSPTPAGIWSELHQLYRHALQQNIQEEEVSDTGASSSVNLTYKQALMLSLADPYRLMQGDVSHILEYLAHFGDQAHLMPLAQPSSPNGFFLVRLDNDKPPKALSQGLGDADARSDVLLNTLDLARTMHQKIQQLEAGEPPHSLGLPQNAKDPAYLNLLRRLLRHWGVTPKRHFTRVPNQANVDICSGLRSVHYFMNGEKHYVTGEAMESHDAEITVKYTSSPIDKSSQQTYTSSKWVIANESAGGIALSKASIEPVQVRVGELIGLRPEKGQEWNVGVVRWVQSDSPTDIELGVQMLAPSALPVVVKPTIAPDEALFQPALMLPELPILKQPATLVAPRGTYQELRELQVIKNGASITVRATKLLEQTATFEIMQFE